MEAAIIELWRPQFVAPVRFLEGRVGHVRRSGAIRRTDRLRPLRAHAWPVVVREVIKRVVVKAAVESLGMGRQSGGSPEAKPEQSRKQEKVPTADHEASSSTRWQ